LVRDLTFKSESLGMALGKTKQRRALECDRCRDGSRSKKTVQNFLYCCLLYKESYHAALIKLYGSLWSWYNRRGPSS